MRSNTVRRIIAVICGILLAAGIVCCFYVKDDELIGTVVIYGILYLFYLLILSKHLKKNDDSKEKSPLRKK